jgi:Fe-S-cluster containining protein
VFCDVSVDDLKRLDRRWVYRNVLGFSSLDRLAAAIDGRPLPAGALRTKDQMVTRGPLMGDSTCRCIALQGDPGHRVSCGIYAKRPEVCRTAVVPGDRTCRSLRREYLTG